MDPESIRVIRKWLVITLLFYGVSLIIFNGCKMYSVLPDEKFETPWDIYNWIHERVEYEMDYVNYWKSPREILRSGKGDCEDFTILFMSLTHDAWGWKPDMQLIEYEIYGKKKLHYWCIYDGVIYEATSGMVVIPEKQTVQWKVLDTIEYDLVMWWATAGYIKSIQGEKDER